MGVFTQSNRAMRLFTPLGRDIFILREFAGTETLSRPYHFTLEVVARTLDDVAFDRLLGKEVTATIELADGGERYFSGIVWSATEQGEFRGDPEITGTSFGLEIVPGFALLRRHVRSRIFQSESVKEILETVLQDLDVDFQLEGVYEPRNYCVQYRESDFDFASRLMEEEGIYYFFIHGENGHQMVVSDSPTAHPQIKGPGSIVYDEIEGGGGDGEARIYQWRKRQQLRSGKYTLRDYNFQLPGKNLETSVPIVTTVSAGKVTHRLDIADTSAQEIYDYPGEYALRFDGITSGGGEQPSNLDKIFTDNERTVKIRMQQEEAGALLIDGESDAAAMMAGHRFDLARHRHGDGTYVLVSVEHRARLPEAGRSGSGFSFEYSNRFTCIPHGLPFRPERLTPRPRVAGCQTAIVVGPAGEEIFTDRYGRVKVQFHWDRAGANDSNSSCWLRVVTPWSGKHWGMIHIPRIGQEVVVDFMEGDPDRPIIIGMVYHPDSMPPWDLPEHKTRSGIQTRSTQDGSASNFNELRFEDLKGKEHVYLHAERNLRVAVERNEVHTVGQHHGSRVKGGRAVLVEGDVKVDLASGELAENGELPDSGSESYGDALVVSKNRYIYVGDVELHEIEKGQTLHVLDGDQILRVTKGDQVIAVEDANQKITVEKDQTIDVKTGNHTLTVDKGNSVTEVKMGDSTLKTSLGKITQEAMAGIELKVGANSIKIEPAGITLKGLSIKIESDTLLEAKGAAIARIDGGALLIAKGALTMIN